MGFVYLCSLYLTKQAYVTQQYIIKSQTFSFELKFSNQLWVAKSGCEFLQTNHITEYLGHSLVLHHDFKDVFTQKFIEGLSAVKFLKFFLIRLSLTEYFDKMGEIEAVPLS